MYIHLWTLFSLLTLALANPEIRKDAAYPIHNRANIQNIYPRQIPATPSVLTTERTANTEFAPPGATASSSGSPPGTQGSTTRAANTETLLASGTSAPPLVSDSTRAANTEAVQPSTPSSGLGVPMATGAMNIEKVLGVVVVGIAGMV